MGKIVVFGGSVVLIKVVKGDEGFNRLMRKCIESGGVPVVITRYAGKPIRYGGRPAVVFRCYGLWDSRGILVVGISQGLWEELDKGR